MVALGFVIVGPLLGLQLAMIFYDGEFFHDLQNIETISGKPQLSSAILIMQGTATLVGLIILPLI